jgi:uncharacterized protein YndB with AHSA1/START domain
MTSAFEAPCREFQAQRSPEQPERWLGPNGHALLLWEVDFRSGGSARLCVRSPEGGDQWVEGVHLEIVEPERVVFTGNLGFGCGAITFRRA